MVLLGAAAAFLVAKAAAVASVAGSLGVIAAATAPPAVGVSLASAIGYGALAVGVVGAGVEVARMFDAPVVSPAAGRTQLRAFFCW